MTVLIVAISYNGSSDFSTLAESLRRNTRNAWHVVVANNSLVRSEAEALDAIADREGNIEHRRMGRNMGYLGAAHAVLSELDLGGYSWVVVANTDLQFEAHFVERLDAISSEHIGAIAPSIIDEQSGRNENPYMVSAPARSVLLKRRLMMFNPATAQATMILKAVAERLGVLSSRAPDTRPGEAIYAPHGAAIILSSEFFARGGDLDYPLFLFGEENYVGSECSRLGLPVIFRPDLEVLHSAHAQTGRLRSRAVLRHMVAAARHLYRESAPRHG